MNAVKRIMALLLLVSALLTLSACAGVEVDELYSLPRFSEEHLQLENLIDEEIAGGCEYYAPTSGSYRQSVQMVDLDGDGQQEAIAFFQTPESMLKICIYRADGGEEFTLAETVDGEGSAIRSIEYADMDADGFTELIIVWQISSDLRMLKAYSLKSWHASVLLSADCTELLVADMDGDGGSELMTIQPDYSGEGTVTMYKLGADSEMESSSVQMSRGLTRMTRIRTGGLSDGGTGLFIESEYEGGLYATEVFALSEGKLRNLTVSAVSGSTRMLRACSVYSTDIDNDRVLEVPSANRLYSQSETSSTYWMLDWYSLDSGGKMARDMSTYHCFSDGWYFVLSDTMRRSLTVRRADSVSGERVVVLSSVDTATGEITDLLEICTLTGENRRDRAKASGRFMLQEGNSAIYAARIIDDSLTQENVRKSFRLIYTEWMTGAV